MLESKIKFITFFHSSNGSTCFEEVHAIIKGPRCFEEVHAIIKGPRCFEGVNAIIKGPRCFEGVNAIIKGPRCFLEQETLLLLLDTGWFQEQI